ncbi:MAG: FlgO family outer membrane protein [Treponema sp.]|nr:FlgO family outer membrane protein [Treponema sp.]
MKRIGLLFGLLALLSAGIFAQQQPTVAVRAFEVSGGLSQDEGNAITDIFISELIGTGRIRVVDRNSFDAIMAEMKFGASSWSNNENVAKLGNAINANYIIQGTVTQLGGRIIITVRVLDINKVQFVSSPNLQLTNMNEIFSKLPPFVRDLALNFTDNSTVYKVGSIGPSGGYVFMDKGLYTDGWRYLEAAPSNYDFNAFVDGYKGGTNPYYQRNVLDLLRPMNINGITGWRIPNRSELLLMYSILKQKGIGEFNNSHYISNEEDWVGDFRYFWSVRFNDGESIIPPPNRVYVVRPIRGF